MEIEGLIRPPLQLVEPEVLWIPLIIRPAFPLGQGEATMFIEILDHIGGSPGLSYPHREFAWFKTGAPVDSEVVEQGPHSGRAYLDQDWR